MGRLAKNVLDRYEISNSDGCAYCGASKSSMWDLTPHHNASDEDKAAFPHTRTRAHICETCWGKVHRANWIERGERFGVARGCMTVDQKKALCTGGSISQAMIRGDRFVVGYGGQLIVPNGLLRDTDDETLFFLQGQKWTREELDLLQGPMALRLLGMPTPTVAVTFYTILSNDLEGALHDVPKYLDLLELPRADNG